MMFKPLPNHGRIYLKTSAGTVIISCTASWMPIFSSQSVDDGDINRVVFIAHFSQQRLQPKIVKQSHYVWVDATEYYLITGLEDFGAHTKITGTRQTVPMAFQVSTGGGIISQYEFRSSSLLLTDEKSLNALSNNGTVLYNSSIPSHLSSEVGSAFFVSASSQYLYCLDANQVQLDITDSITLALWIKCVNHTGTQALVSKAATVPDRGFYLYKNGSGNGVLELSNDGTAADSVQGGTILPLNIWMSLAAVYNRTDMRIYLNGVLDCTPAAKTTGIYNNAQMFALGARGDATQLLNGYLANVFICNQTKSAANILSWHQTGVMP